MLGGNLGNTFLTSLDANLGKNLLAAGGYTNDYVLANRGISSTDNVPIIVAYSISSKQIYWMISDLSKLNYVINSIRLSPNGNYLIAMVSPPSIGSGFIQLYDSLTGVLI